MIQQKEDDAIAVYKDGDKWRVIYRYTNWKGERKQTQKRGFATKREAQAWERKIAEIEPKDVIAWQNKMHAYKGENGEVYSPDYFKTIHAQRSAIFNHAVRFYHLPSNPADGNGGQAGY